MDYYVQLSDLENRQLSGEDEARMRDLVAAVIHLRD